MYQKRVDRFRARLDPPNDAGGEGDFLAFSRLRLLLLKADGRPSSTCATATDRRRGARRCVERDLDLEESRLATD